MLFPPKLGGEIDISPPDLRGLGGQFPPQIPEAWGGNPGRSPPKVGQISDLAENLPPKRLGGNGFWDLPPKMEAFPPKILGGNENFLGGTAFEESRSPPKSETLGGQ